MIRDFVAVVGRQNQASDRPWQRRVASRASRSQNTRYSGTKRTDHHARARFTKSESSGSRPKISENNVDLAILEGFGSLVERELNVPEIAAVKTFPEATDASRRHKPIVTFTSPAVLRTKAGKPVMDVLAEPEKIVAIV